MGLLPQDLELGRYERGQGGEGEGEGGEDGTEHKFSYKIFNPTREEILLLEGRATRGPLFE